MQLWTVSHSEMTQIYVESSMTCSKSTVIAQRPSQPPHPSSSITSLICPTVCATIIQNCIVATGDIYHGEVSSIAEYYLHNSRTSFILDTREPVYLGNISAIDFSVRLGQSKNPFLLGTQVSSIISVTPACLPLSVLPPHH